MLKRTAEIQGSILTDFVVSAVHEAAQHAIDQGEVVRLSLAAPERFAQVILPPPAPPPGSLGARLHPSPQAATTYLEGKSQDLTPVTLDPGDPR